MHRNYIATGNRAAHCQMLPAEASQSTRVHLFEAVFCMFSPSRVLCCQISHPTSYARSASTNCASASPLAPFEQFLILRISKALPASERRSKTRPSLKATLDKLRPGVADDAFCAADTEEQEADCDHSAIMLRFATAHDSHGASITRRSADC